jgi:hypothetical protein
VTEIHNLVMSDVLKGVRLEWMAEGVPMETIEELQAVMKSVRGVFGLHHPKSSLQHKSCGLQSSRPEWRRQMPALCSLKMTHPHPGPRCALLLVI